jgi:hypothetical protein
MIDDEKSGGRVHFRADRNLAPTRNVKKRAVLLPRSRTYFFRQEPPASW